MFPINLVALGLPLFSTAFSFLLLTLFFFGRTQPLVLSVRRKQHEININISWMWRHLYRALLFCAPFSRAVNAGSFCEARCVEPMASVCLQVASPCAHAHDM